MGNKLQPWLLALTVDLVERLRWLDWHVTQDATMFLALVFPLAGLPKLP